MLYYSSLFTFTHSLLNLRNFAANLALLRLRAFWGALLAEIWWRGAQNILVDRASGCTLFLQSAELVSSATGSHHLSI